MVNDAGFFLSHRLPIALAAQNSGYDVHIATPLDAASDKIRQHGLQYHPIPLTRAGTSLLAEAHAVVAMTRLMFSLKPDIVHLVTIKPVLYGSIAARLARVQGQLLAVSGLGPAFSGSAGIKARLLRFAVETLYRIAFSGKRQKIVFQNSEDMSVLTSITGITADKAVLIRGSGVDLDQYRHEPEPSGVPIVFMASRLVEGKGADLFVEAARQIHKRGIVARFQLAGVPDPHSPTAVDAATFEQWRRDGAVEVLGQRNDIPHLLAGASIVVLPSSYREGLPKVLIEAAACGRPIITTDRPGCRDAVISGTSGLLVPANDLNALVAAIVKLLADPALRQTMGNAGRALADKEFGVQGVIKRHLELYQGLC